MAASYGVSIEPVQDSVLDGRLRSAAAISVVRYDTPTGNPVSVGKGRSRGWTWSAAVRNAAKVYDDIIEADRRKRRDEVNANIARLVALPAGDVPSGL